MNPHDTVFILLPVSEPPEEQGWYTCYAGDEFLGQDWFAEGKFSHKPVTHWLKPVKLSEITTSQPVKRNEDILVKALEEAQHHIDTWPDEPIRAIRLVSKCVSAALSSYRTPVK